MTYLFHSNYPYFQALHLGRYIRWLARIEVQLLAGLAPTQQLCHLAYSAGNVVFKNKLFDPGISPEEFAQRQAEEARRNALSEEEREKELEEIVARLRGDEFDDSNAEDCWRAPVKDRNRVIEFVQLSHTVLKPLADFATPGDCLVEDIVVRYLNGPRRREDLRGIYGLLAAWDLMRMRHEGRPPYSVRFAPGFAESLREAVEDEGGEKPPDAEVEAMLQQLSRPREYRMTPRDFATARFGVFRARKTGVIPESVARDLLIQLKRWTDSGPVERPEGRPL